LFCCVDAKQHCNTLAVEGIRVVTVGVEDPSSGTWYNDNNSPKAIELKQIAAQYNTSAGTASISNMI